VPTFDPEVQMFVGGQWVQIVGDQANDVLARDSLTITRGHADWSSQVQPSRATMSLKNPTGRYSPRHPRSPYYGLLGRNTPIKVFMGGQCKFHGEVSEWPPRGNPDRYVPIEAAGVLRRLGGDGADPLRSVMYRTMMRDTTLQRPVAYWPCEEEAGAARLYSQVGRNAPIRVNPAVRIGAYSGIASTAPIPVIGNTQFFADISPHAANITMTAMCLAHLPDDSVAANNTALMTGNTTGSARYWRIRVNIDRTLSLQIANGDGSVFSTSANTSFAIAPEGAIILLELTTNGSATDWSLRVLSLGHSGSNSNSGSAAGRSYNRINRLTFGSGTNLGDTAIGHVALFTGTVDDTILLNALNGYSGEEAGLRMQRLCGEENVPFAGVGNLADTMRMGAQGQKTFIDLLTECATADGGILHEPMEMPVGDLPGLGYRTRASLYNETARLTADFGDNQVALPFEPTDDDQLLMNDVSVTRDNGATFRTEITDGPLGIDTVGRKRGGPGTVNVETDLDAEQISGWLAGLGTWDESRVPTLTLSLTRNPGLVAAVNTLDVGYRITLVNPPGWLPPDNIDLMVQGSTETLDSRSWTVVYNCTPYGPFAIVRLDSGPVLKVMAVDSQVNTAIDATSGSLSVKSVSGRWLWTTDPTACPILIRVGGEVMQVNSITGTSSPQTFTVTRGINGYQNDHPVGTVVQTAGRSTIGL
jgi:hypothetical protein